tara:strand:- start:487 stop:1077 length:591 start_codon:yes stop_codon:yes gene_type:complete
MFKKIFFCNLIFLLTLSSLSKSAESSGMPQLDTKFWFSQIFWLILSFGILFIILSKFILPKISGNLEARRSQILENIEKADEQRKNSEEKTKQYEDAILKSKNEAKKYFNDAKQKILSDIKKKSNNLENQIGNEIKSAEEEIIKLKLNSAGTINKIAIETSQDLIKQIIGAEVNNSSISAVVDDLSKKNKEKFYEV